MKPEAEAKSKSQPRKKTKGKGRVKQSKEDGEATDTEDLTELSEEQIEKMKKGMQKKLEDEAIFVVTASHTIVAGLLDEDVDSKLAVKKAASTKQDDADSSETPPDIVPKNKKEKQEKKREEAKIEEAKMEEEKKIEEAKLEEEKKKAEKKKRETYEETYEVVGIIMDSKVEWMCDDPTQYEGYADKTTYFSKDGYSMVHGLRFQDRIKARELAVVAEKERVIEEEKQRVIAEKEAKRVAKKAAQKGKRKAVCWKLCPTKSDSC